MVEDILEQNKNELEKYKHDKIVALLKDESNLIQDHLVLLEENEKLKNDLEFIFKHFSIPPKCFIYEEKRKERREYEKREAVPFGEKLDTV